MAVCPYGYEYENYFTKEIQSVLIIRVLYYCERKKEKNIDKIREKKRQKYNFTNFGEI